MELSPARPEDSRHDRCGANDCEPQDDGDSGEPPSKRAKQQVQEGCQDHDGNSKGDAGNALGAPGLFKDDGNTSAAGVATGPASHLLHKVQLEEDNFGFLLGRGDTGYVQAYWFGDVLTALKVADLDTEEGQSLLHEAHVYNILKPLWGKIVPRVVEHGVCDNGEAVCFATQALAARPLDPSLDSDLLPQLQQQLTEIHALGVVHNDIELDNILVETDGDRKRTWFIDFNAARVAACHGIDTVDAERLKGLQGVDMTWLERLFPSKKTKKNKKKAVSPLQDAQA